MIAIVTGSSNQEGIGFHVAKKILDEGNTVVITSRNTLEGKSALQSLSKYGNRVCHHELEITSLESIKKFTGFVSRKFGKVDILVNNIGVLKSEKSVTTAKEVLGVNFYGVYNFTNEILPFINENGRIVNVSSVRGKCQGINKDLKLEFLNFNNFEEIKKLLDDFLYALEKNDLGKYGGWNDRLLYSVSKLAQNGFVRHLTKKLLVTQTVSCCCPGWCRTQMGGSQAILSPSEGAETPSWLALNSKKDEYFDGSFFFIKRRIEF